MSTVKICDHCRKVYEIDFDKYCEVHIGIMRIRRFDLCPKCYRALKRWLKGGCELPDLGVEE